MIGSSHQENQREQNRPKTTTAPRQKLVASAFLEIAIESVAMNSPLLFVSPPSKNRANLVRLHGPESISFCFQSAPC